MTLNSDFFSCFGLVAFRSALCPSGAGVVFYATAFLFFKIFVAICFNLAISNLGFFGDSAYFLGVSAGFLGASADFLVIYYNFKSALGSEGAVESAGAETGACGGRDAAVAGAEGSEAVGSNAVDYISSDLFSTSPGKALVKSAVGIPIAAKD